MSNDKRSSWSVDSYDDQVAIEHLLTPALEAAARWAREVDLSRLGVRAANPSRAAMALEAHILSLIKDPEARVIADKVGLLIVDCTFETAR